MVRLTVLALTLAACTATGWYAAPAGAKQVGHRPTPLKAIVLNMGTEGTAVTDARYGRFFKGGDAAAGVASVIAAGRFSINGYAIPGSEAAFRRLGGTGYLVNQMPWLSYDAADATWKGGYKAEKAVPCYAAAALATATGIVSGLEVRLWDSDGDGYADRIDADYKEGVIAGRITRNRDGTYSVYRGAIDTANRTPQEGRVFDGAHFTMTSGERIKRRDFDSTIVPGDVALFWYGRGGWAMQRAKQVRGAFLGGTDHRNYDIDGVTYQDAMRFSRDNLPVSNRPGEYANARTYFGLDKPASGGTVSLWLVPTTAADAQGAPVALTSGADAKLYLAKAITAAEAKLRGVVVSQDGGGVPSGSKWVSQAAYTRLAEAIARARLALRLASGDAALLDYQVYLLYLSLAGSGRDIGAKFGDFEYTGFDNEVLKAGRTAPKS